MVERRVYGVKIKIKIIGKSMVLITFFVELEELLVRIIGWGKSISITFVVGRIIDEILTIILY